MGQLDLGGIYVDYSPKGRDGWGQVDLTIIRHERQTAALEQPLRLMRVRRARKNPRRISARVGE